MSILITAMALAAAPAPTVAQSVPAVAPATHAQHAHPGAKPEAKAQAKSGCCCEKMAEGGKMECCAKHGKDHSVEHSEHSTSH